MNRQFYATFAPTPARNSKLGGDSGDKGGKMRAAMTGSAGAAKSGYAPDPTKLASWEYTQAKEVTIVCRAVTVSTFSGTDETKFNKADYEQLVSVNKIPDFKTLDFKSENDVWGYLKYLMGGFLQSFRQ